MGRLCLPIGLHDRARANPTNVGHTPAVRAKARRGMEPSPLTWGVVALHPVEYPSGGANPAEAGRIRIATSNTIQSHEHGTTSHMVQQLAQIGDPIPRGWDMFCDAAFRMPVQQSQSHPHVLFDGTCVPQYDTTHPESGWYHPESGWDMSIEAGAIKSLEEQIPPKWDILYRCAGAGPCV